MTDDLGIVLPAFAPDVDRLVRYVSHLETELSPGAMRIEVDGASPTAVDRLRETAATVNASPDRRGKGAAITCGFDALETPVLAFVDADGSTPPDSLAAIVSPIREDRADVAVGSRRHPAADVRIHQTAFRRRAGDVFVRIAQALLPVALYDYQCGAKAIRSTTWDLIRADIVTPGFAWDIDFLTAAALHDASIIEVPIVWEDKAGTTVPVLSTGVEFATAVFRARHRMACQRGNTFHRTLERFLPDPDPLEVDAGFDG